MQGLADWFPTFWVSGSTPCFTIICYNVICVGVLKWFQIIFMANTQCIAELYWCNLISIVLYWSTTTILLKWWNLYMFGQIFSLLGTSRPNVSCAKEQLFPVISTYDARRQPCHSGGFMQHILAPGSKKSCRSWTFCRKNDRDLILNNPLE